jgi:hypothetical protein
MIEAMVLAGQFSANLSVCKEGADDWISLDSLIQPPLFTNEITERSKEKNGTDSPDNGPLIIVACVVATLIVCGIAIGVSSKPSQSKSYSSEKTSYKPPTSNYIPPKTTYLPAGDTPKTEYKSLNSSADSLVYNDAQGRTYRVPNASYQRLNAKKAQLESRHRSIKVAQAELDSMSEELNRLTDTIDRTSKYQIDSFNDKVRSYNTKNSQIQIQRDYFNAAVRDFNADLERVGTLIR